MNIKIIKVLSSTLFLATSLCAWANPGAEPAFLEQLEKLENRNNKTIIEDVKKSYLNACQSQITKADILSYTASTDLDNLGMPEESIVLEICENKRTEDDFNKAFRFDGAAFHAAWIKEYPLEMFLTANGFSIGAQYNGKEQFHLLAEIPNKKQYAPAFDAAFDRVLKEDADSLTQIAAAQEIRTNSTPLHIIAQTMPSTKNSNIRAVSRNTSTSFQERLLRAYTGEKLKKVYCEMLPVKDKNGNTPFDLAFIENNRTAFYNLMHYARKAGCDLAQIKELLSQPNSTGSSVAQAAAEMGPPAKDINGIIDYITHPYPPKYQNMDKNSFYSNVIQLFDFPLPRNYTKESEEKLRKQEEAFAAARKAAEEKAQKAAAPLESHLSGTTKNAPPAKVSPVSKTVPVKTVKAPNTSAKKDPSDYFSLSQEHRDAITQELKSHFNDQADFEEIDRLARALAKKNAAHLQKNYTDYDSFKNTQAQINKELAAYLDYAEKHGKKGLLSADRAKSYYYSVILQSEREAQAKAK